MSHQPKILAVTLWLASSLCLSTAFAEEPQVPAAPSAQPPTDSSSSKTYRRISDMALEMFDDSVKQAAMDAAQRAQSAPSKGVVADDARQYVDAVQAYYDKAKTYSAAFEQEYEAVDGVKKSSAGVVWFKKPGLMRWDYEKPESRFLISDGESFWSWEPEYRQYCKQNLKASQLPTALSFLTGTGRLEDEFSVKLGKISGDQVQLLLTPVKPSMAFDKIAFELLMPTAKVYRATIYDAMGNFNRITFKSPEINGALEDSSFQFSPPSDARHICQ